tara:strand:- start:1626 stop:2237 length:612 start_codon:yes stop_codon:yes gene_type:complete
MTTTNTTNNEDQTMTKPWLTKKLHLTLETLLNHHTYMTTLELAEELGCAKATMYGRLRKLEALLIMDDGKSLITISGGVHLGWTVLDENEAAVREILAQPGHPGRTLVIRRYKQPEGKPEVEANEPTNNDTRLYAKSRCPICGAGIMAEQVIVRGKLVLDAEFRKVVDAGEQTIVDELEIFCEGLPSHTQAEMAAHKNTASVG